MVVDLNDLHIAHWVSKIQASPNLFSNVMLGLRFLGSRVGSALRSYSSVSAPKAVKEGTFLPLSPASPTSNANFSAIFEPLPKKRSGENVLKFLHKELLKKHDPTGKRTALVSPGGLRAGDVIKVSYNDRTTVLGQLIGIKRGNYNLGTNLHIRNKMNKIGVEMRIPLYSPNIKNIEIVSRPKTYPSRNKHYYIRNNRLDVGNLEEHQKSWAK